MLHHFTARRCPSADPHRRPCDSRIFCKPNGSDRVTMTAEMGDLVGAGSSARGPPAGAVVVPAEASAPATTTVSTRVSARVTLVGAAAGAALPAAARAPPPRLRARQALAAALFLLGCAAAGLAFFAMILPTAGKACVPTDAEVARLRTASEHLLLTALSQMLVATVGLLVPAWPVVGGAMLGVLTVHAYDVLGMLITSCHGSALHGAIVSCL